MITTNFDPPISIEQFCSITDRSELEAAYDRLRRWERSHLLKLGHDRVRRISMAKCLRESMLWEFAQSYKVDMSIFELNESSIAIRFIDHVRIYKWIPVVDELFDEADSNYVFDCYSPYAIKDESGIPGAVERFIGMLNDNFHLYWNEEVVPDQPYIRLEDIDWFKQQLYLSKNRATSTV